MKKEEVKSELSLEIGKRMRDARNSLKLTLADVCQELNDGSIPSRLSNYENGARELPISLAKKLQPILMVSAEYLLTLSNNTTNVKKMANDLANKDLLLSHLIEIFDALDYSEKNKLVIYAGKLASETKKLEGTKFNPYPNKPNQ